MIKIEISSVKPDRRQGIGKTSGRPYDFIIQEAYAFLVHPDGEPHKYPSKFKTMLDGSEAPHLPGFYTLHPSGFYVRDEKLTYSSSPVLVPVKASA